MKFVSVDIETTGLNPLKHQILEMAFIYSDLENKDFKKVFHAIIQHREIIGDPVALMINAELIKRIAIDKLENIGHYENGVPNYFFVTDTREPYILSELLGWLSEIKITKDNKAMFAGKNVGKFDWQFLDRFGSQALMERFRSRIIDVGNLYLQRNDDTIPDLKECMKRANIEGNVPHTALEDAEIVREIIFRHFEKENQKI